MFTLSIVFIVGNKSKSTFLALFHFTGLQSVVKEEDLLSDGEGAHTQAGLNTGLDPSSPAVTSQVILNGNNLLFQFLHNHCQLLAKFICLLQSTLALLLSI